MTGPVGPVRHGDHMNDALDRTWDWRVLTRECPACGAAIPEDGTQTHKAWHWLTNTEPRQVEAHR